MKFGFGIALAGLLGLAPTALAGDNDWESPVYNYFYQFPLPIPPQAEVKTSYFNERTQTWIDFYEVHIREFQKKVYPNLPGISTMVGYDGISPGPTFRIPKGREALVRFVNDYGRPSSIHLHGSYSRAPFDGWAEDVIEPGQYKDYYYPNQQEARTLWYHDHAIHITALNAYYGQAGFYIIYDPAEEARLGLPQGKYDISLMIQSKKYRSNGELFSVEGETTSLWGDVIHVNGQPWPFLNVEPRKYRFRLLDASVSRAFRLSFVETGKTTPITFQVISADAGYLSRPITTSDLYLAMAERYDIIIDFAAWKGKKITMRNARKVMKDDDFAGTDRVMQFVVGNTVTDFSNNGGPPSSLTSLDMPPPKSSLDHSFRFARTNSMWTINGVAFADVENRVLAKPKRGSVELWELENNSGGWSHPIHIHLVDFQVISRSGGRAVQPYEQVALKDVVLLGPNEKVRVLARYAPWDGVYMFHCHNLVHEDHDMMAAFNVSVLEDFGYPETTRFIDPMESRWRAKPYAGTDLATIKSETLPFFAGLDAYAHVDEVNDALIEYHRTHVEGQTTTTTTSTTSTPTAVPTTTTPTTTTTKTSTSTARGLNGGATIRTSTGKPRTSTSTTRRLRFARRTAVPMA